MSLLRTDLWLRARRGGKSEVSRLALECALEQGRTVIVAKPEGWTKWKRVRFGAFKMDLVEPMEFGALAKPVPEYTDQTPENPSKR